MAAAEFLRPTQQSARVCTLTHSGPRINSSEIDARLVKMESTLQTLVKLIGRPDNSGDVGSQHNGNIDGFQGPPISLTALRTDR